MSNKHELEAKIIAAEAKLKETLEDAYSTRGNLSDALRVVIPMMQDQYRIMTEILDYAAPR